MPHRLEFWPGTSSGYRSEPQRDVARIACDHQFVATRHQDEGSADQRPQKVASERSGQWIMAVYLRGGARWTPRRDFEVSNDGFETVTDREVVETGRDTPLPLGELSPVELVESRLDRIARLDTRLPKHARCARCTDGVCVAVRGMRGSFLTIRFSPDCKPGSGAGLSAR